MTIDDRALGRLTGGLLTMATGLVLAGGITLGASGALPAFSDFLGGSPGAMAQYLSPLTAGTYLYAAAWTVLLLGSVSLTRLVLRAGDDLIAPMALAATTVATVLGILEATFTIGVTTWAVREAAGGGLPAIYVVLESWTGQMQDVYIVLGLAAQVGFSVKLVRSRLISAWIGWIAGAWALTWLPLRGLGIPALLFFWPLVIGVALLVSPRSIPSANAKEAG